MADPKKVKFSAPALRIAVAQMNPTVGDFEDNSRKIIQWIRSAENQRADLIVFPELALSGYPVWDLANKKPFVQEGLRRLDQITRATSKLKIAAALGFIDKARKPGQRSLNSMAWIAGGKILSRHVKRLLPTYDVFLEEIFFERGEGSRVIPWRGRRIGPAICEDLWDSRYREKPLADLAAQKADLIVSISASPYYRGVAEARDALIKNHALRYKMPILYVNQVGGQDDLIFDGRSFFADETGRILFRAPAFQEGLFFFEWKRGMHSSEFSMPASTGSPAEVYQALVLGVRDYCRKNRFDKAVIGLSGGIDSALVAALAVDALGKDAVTGITMPGEYSSRGSWEDSRDLATRLPAGRCTCEAPRLLEGEAQGQAPRNATAHRPPPASGAELRGQGGRVLSLP